MPSINSHATVSGSCALLLLPVKQLDRNEIMVELIDGRRIDISELSVTELRHLQCQQEPAFAAAIARAPKDSLQRAQITSLGYATICAILACMARRQQQAECGFSMGMDPRYSDLISRLLTQQVARGVQGGLFEVGFSSGVLLEQVAQQGFDVGGVEVVGELVAQAKKRIDARHHPSLLLGDFRKLDLSTHAGKYSLVYWNDVFEHIPTDEILDYLVVIRSLLCEGGMLVSITPNWHMRPSDVTVEFSPPRSEAIGFHLKEYRLGEVSQLLRQAGFSAVHTPTWISRRRIYTSPVSDFTRLKIMLEPLLEWLPYRVAVQVCRRAGFNCTFATR